MTSMNLNFAFVRHGYGCHNSVSPLYKNNVIKREDIDSLQIADPELTPIGVEASINNGCLVEKVLLKMPKLANNNNMNMEQMHVVACSPLIRSMETAYYMTKKWKSPPSKIYVMPLLREIDEGSDDIYSEGSRIVMDTTPSYMMKSIKEQKKYLEKIGILQYFNFGFIEEENDSENLRKEPGDVKRFIEWIAALDFKTKLKNMNLFIVTHAGVLREFSNQGYKNNSGFVINVTYENISDDADIDISYNKFFDLNKYLPSHFFTMYSDPEYTNADYFCPSNRCGNLCNILNKSQPKKLNLQCDD